MTIQDGRDGEWNPPEQEVEYRNVAWEVVTSLPVGQLLGDCVDALVEAYQLNEELYIADKQMLEEEDTKNETMPMTTYINTATEKEQEEQDVNTTQ